ncbi:glycine dehydrogenase (decarboxylating) alpha subunit /glycine dehydrogenase (decarboxylating) beta subunit [Halospina denitrificans]|uniref:Glycine dehydrogenase (decarboxylating) n=1 Tax=Halospina denitrificans TaxID=332522 RepID=A0A4R7JNA5_9GAMM|nr:aminomethyl-transferring glycine dehydrogenase [Halospina denitrificans]TDT39315.1 glycine dehydrogenase (decarboxylating) alpha subunit /glycine dehydrogenase (decarboxylating) beta subunit [Halospina denitrificans]
MNAKSPLAGTTLSQLNKRPFSDRHIGPGASDQSEMLRTLDLSSVHELVDQIIPENIRMPNDLNMDQGRTEDRALAELQEIARENTVNRSFIGQGYYPTRIPAVIKRNVLQNPAWYTAYTPYQPEISQGRLESLVNFQQVVMDLSGLDLANASLLDEATAAAEAMALCKRGNRRNKSNVFFAAEDLHPQTLDVLKTRAAYMDIDLVIAPADEIGNHQPFGAAFQYPGTDGNIPDLEALIKTASDQGAMVSVASDLLALMLLRSPGELGADIVFGSAQRFGVPMAYGGPHAAFFATRDNLKRMVPGRIIGVSKDNRDQPAFRMAMQTREQHIRREKATSNICTAQALLANLAAFFAVYHGPEGLRKQAERVHRLTAILAEGLRAGGLKPQERYFDTLSFEADDSVHDRAHKAGCNLRRLADGRVGISLDETTGGEDVALLFDIVLGSGHGQSVTELDALITSGASTGITQDMRRQDAVLTHPVFNRYHSETELLRYIRRLENRDFSLVHGMIPLGSCTMKLNAAAQMEPITWPEFAEIHPYAPADQTRGYQKMLQQLDEQLQEITGYDAFSLQPNSGAQGEYAGLLAIRRYQQAQGEGHRNVCLIPASAHGTNPASAAMMGMKVVIVDCDSEGNVDLDDLRAKAEKAGDNLSSCMITYPSTHGVYEEGAADLCQIIHDHGGQVYMDGANLNAQVGLVQPTLVGSDVSHLNLHKTFAIPHGGGGPGMGPIGVRSHLAPYLPGHGDTGDAEGAVAATPYGSAGILPITWMYNRLLGRDGLKHSTEVAILSANYIANALQEDYSVLYRGRHGRVAHECILDLRPLKDWSGITEEDVAKRLMDYGFHAPTMSFPVPGTLMIEPTESESLEELDRFIHAMKGIRREIDQVAAGEWPADNNPLVNAPHTQTDLVDDEWNRPYSRELAVFPSEAVRASKFWPAVNRVDNVYGDRNLICSCPSPEAYRD